MHLLSRLDYMREYDVHLAASSISPVTVRSLHEVGFKRDAFANNTRCQASAFHGTYRGNRALPDDGMWNETCRLLLSDPTFAGSLEEEYVEDRFVQYFDGAFGGKTPTLKRIGITQIAPKEHKACDIHIGINLDKSSTNAVQSVENLNVAYFERQADDGLRRIYSITCEAKEDGIILFERLATLLAHIPNLHGRIKLEFTSRWLRYPDDAVALPITTTDAVRRWL